MVLNQGNATAHFALGSNDDEGNLSLQFENGSTTKSTLSVAAGETSNTKLAVSAPRRWFGSPVPHSFAVDAVLEESRERNSANARFIHSALFPRWILTALVLIIVALGWLSHLVLKPEVELRIPQTRVTAGQPVTIDVHAKRAWGGVTLDPTPNQAIASTSQSYTFEHGFAAPSAKVTVTASNFFGSDAHTVRSPLKLLSSRLL